MYSETQTYLKYITTKCQEIDATCLETLTRILETTNWEEPQSARDFNNVAVIALIEAENCQDLSLRALYLDIASESLQTGWELETDPLCVAHLSFLLSMTGQVEEAKVEALFAWLNTLEQTEENQQNQDSVDVIYFPPNSQKLSSNLILRIVQETSYKDRILMLLSEALRYSTTYLYNEGGMRWLYNAYHYFSSTWEFCLGLGLYAIMRQQWEGFLNLYRAKELNPNHPQIFQALYLAYRTLGNEEKANYWLNTALHHNQNDSNALAWQWTKLDSKSFFTYIVFEADILLAIQASLSSIVTGVLMAEGDWFENEMEFWRNKIQPGMTVIDVGANVGVYTFSAAQRVGATGKVIAVEPFSGCVQCLQETCRINHFDWVKIYAGAASDSVGERKLALHSASEINTIIAEDTYLINEEKVEVVDCFTLDSLISNECLQQVDFIKIDAEGHELAVLMGSQQILIQFSPTILYENISGSQNSNVIVANYLIDQGYLLFRYQPYLQNLVPIDNLEDLENCLNIIAIHRTQLSAPENNHQETSVQKNSEDFYDFGMNNIYSEQEKVLYCGWNKGFFSNCTVILWAIIDLYNRGIIPNSLDFSSGFNAYKTSDQVSNEVNVYPHFFDTHPTSLMISQKYLLRQNHHGIYKDYSFIGYTPLINRYFSLNQEILAIQSQLIQKYDIDFSQLISICYRGTDKFSEVDLANPVSYIRITQKLLIQHPNYRVLIQTDQQQIRDMFMSNFAKQCFFIEEMPVTQDDVPLHANPRLLKQFGLDNYQFAKLLLAVIHLLSQSQYIINHTGNVASWICLFRGNADRVFQFNQKGVLILPPN